MVFFIVINGEKGMTNSCCPLQVDGPLRQKPVERRQSGRLCPLVLQRDDSCRHPGAEVRLIKKGDMNI